MPTAPQALADASVVDEKNEAHALGSAWRERTAVVAFVRHFG